MNCSITYTDKLASLADELFKTIQKEKKREITREISGEITQNKKLKNSEREDL